MMGDTGWSPEEVGQRTFDQLLAVLKGIQKRSEMMWGTGESKATGDNVVDGTSMLERRLQMMREQTGKKVFDLREVI